MATRRSGLLGLLGLLCGCAGGLNVERKLVQIEVVTPEAVGRLEFSASRGIPFDIPMVPAGRTIYALSLRPGEYCLHAYVWGDLTVGHGVRLDQPQCFRVQPEDADVTYRGHVEFDRQRRVRLYRNRDAFIRDMKDSAVEKVRLQTGPQ